MKIKLADRTFTISRNGEPYAEDNVSYQLLVIKDDDTERVAGTMVELTNDGQLDLDDYGFCEDLWGLYLHITGKYGGDDPFQIIPEEP